MAVNGESPVVDEIARERAESAIETARNAWEGVGQVLREVAGLRSELREGFSRLEKRLSSRASKADVEAIEDELEITAVRNLRKELAAVKRRQGAVLKWGAGIAGALIVAAVCTWLGLHH
jgi:hypothetical protein